ncbi:MAG TPA: hypothetical protein VFN76_06185, partial [Candidatus Limnocylindria bacterium]|nr:hypothetical protein [Candidatus Limnocylindria bacterium]
MKRHRELAAELRIARRASLFIVLAILAAGCGMLQPTPARFRPPLPDPVPMPGIAVEDVVEQMERSGYACQFAPQSDQPAS